MAINSNPSLPNRHTLYLAMTGGGKSQAMSQNKAIPGRGVRCVLFDPDEDHKAQRYYSLKAFKQALINALILNTKTGRGFRIAYCGDATAKIFDQWCEYVWSILDGKKETYILIDESASALDETGKATGYAGKLFRQARKYNGILHVTSTRATEIPKTVTTACSIKFIGLHDDYDHPYIAKRYGIQPDDLAQLKPLQFIVKTPGTGHNRLEKFRYKSTK